MKFVDKIKNLNKYIGFHIYSFCGWISILGIPLFLITQKSNCNSSYDWFVSFVVLSIIVSINFIIITITTWIIMFEYIFNRELKNDFLLNNKYLKILRYVGASISTIFVLVYSLIFFSIIIFRCINS